MCGRYTLFSTVAILSHLEIEDGSDIEWNPHFNIAPTQETLVVTFHDGSRHLSLMKWGLIPSWTREKAAGIINARAETLTDKSSFKAAFRKQRCIVPANGFFEWKHGPKGKIPMFIHQNKNLLMGFAGLWDTWIDKHGDILETFTIITTDANELIRSIHDRMPVILSPSDYGKWLSPRAELEDLKELLKPAEHSLTMHEVSPGVNSPKTDGPQLIQTT